MNTVSLNCQRCLRKSLVSAPDPQRAWNIALARGWAVSNGDLICPAENPAWIEFGNLNVRE